MTASPPIDYAAAARLLTALADAADHTPPKMRARHLAVKARALATQFRRMADEADPQRLAA